MREFDRDAPPADVTAVRSPSGTVFRRDGVAWKADGVPMYWQVLRAGCSGPLTEHRDDKGDTRA